MYLIAFSLITATFWAALLALLGASSGAVLTTFIVVVIAAIIMLGICMGSSKLSRQEEYYAFERYRKNNT